jgi:Astacin (Peptidase family M12A)
LFLSRFPSKSESDEEDAKTNDSYKDDVDVASQIVVGDMILNEEQYSYLFVKDCLKQPLNAFNIWPNGVVPVMIDESFDTSYKRAIITAMHYIMNLSCIKFDLDADTSDNYVMIEKESRVCGSEVGYLRKGKQVVKLDQRCGPGNIIHELLHTLGLLHSNEKSF